MATKKAKTPNQKKGQKKPDQQLNYGAPKTKKGGRVQVVKSSQTGGQ
jgi:hypothetical protein